MVAPGYRQGVTSFEYAKISQFYYTPTKKKQQQAEPAHQQQQKYQQRLYVSLQAYIDTPALRPYFADLDFPLVFLLMLLICCTYVHIYMLP